MLFTIQLSWLLFKIRVNKKLNAKTLGCEDAIMLLPAENMGDQSKP